MARDNTIYLGSREYEYRKALKINRRATFSIDISVLGDTELSRVLNSLEGMNRSGMFGDASVKAMEIVHRRILATVPIDTGTLINAFANKNNIRKIQPGKAKGLAGARVLFPPRRFLKIKQGAKGFYPAAQEFGWRTRSGDYIPGKRFVRDALYGSRSAVFAKLKTELWKIILRRMKRRKMIIPDSVLQGVATE